MKHKGNLEELQAVVSSIGLSGDWSIAKGGNHKFDGLSGEVINWWPKTGTVQVQGQNRDAIQNLLAEPISGGLNDGPVVTPRRNDEKHIFVVHGHDREARDQLELVLMRLGLKPFILVNNDSGSKTIIEALEQTIYEESAFGIVLMTPDDFGYSKLDGETEKKPRVRQNVLLEMGMVMAALGRDKMAIIQKGALERPSDTDGILRIEYNDHIREIVPKLAERLRNAGFALDAKSISTASS